MRGEGQRRASSPVPMNTTSLKEERQSPSYSHNRRGSLGTVSTDDASASWPPSPHSLSSSPPSSSEDQNIIHSASWGSSSTSSSHKTIKIVYIPVDRKEVAIIGAGWNGAHIACELAKKGYDVTLFDAKDTLFSGISGTFGIRLHAGPHYPKSLATRKAIHQGYATFCRDYPELVCEHEWSVYAYGKRDEDGKPSVVSGNDFRSVVEEYQFKGAVNLDEMGINSEEVENAYNLAEPSILLGDNLRDFFRVRLEKSGVKVRYNFTVTDVKKVAYDDHKSSRITVSNGEEQYEFDHVINATSFQSLLPKTLPLGMEVVYQPLLALRVRDKMPGEKPVSFITMAGMFPCLMPVVLDKSKPVDDYIVTHAKYTTVGSFATAEEAWAAYQKIDDGFIETHVKNQTLNHMQRLWPAFSERFEYVGWRGTVLAKIRTNTEFRAAITFQHDETGMIYVFPGKVTNVHDAELEAGKLMAGVGVETTDGFRFVKEGVLDDAKVEITETIQDPTRVVTYLQTHVKALDEKENQQKLIQEQKFLSIDSREMSDPPSQGAQDIAIDMSSNKGETSPRTSPPILLKPFSSNQAEQDILIDITSIDRRSDATCCSSKQSAYALKGSALAVTEFIVFMMFDELRKNALAGAGVGLGVLVLFLVADHFLPGKNKVSDLFSPCLFKLFHCNSKQHEGYEQLVECNDNNLCC